MHSLALRSWIPRRRTLQFSFTQATSRFMMMRKHAISAAATAAVALTFLLAARAQDKPSAPPAAQPRYSGQTEKGFLLPNGWTLTPAGEHVALTYLPLNIIPLADGRHALAATSGYNNHNLSLIDLDSNATAANETV